MKRSHLELWYYRERYLLALGEHDLQPDWRDTN